MVPTASGFAGPANPSRHDDDFYLHLHLPPELDLPMPATTQIYHQPPTSYLIPRWDLGPGSGAFTRIEFPPVGSRPGVQEDVDTFETILAQCTAFLERAPPPPTSDRSKAAEAKAAEAAAEATTAAPPPPYNPAEYDPGEGYVQGSHSANSGKGGRIVLVDEEDGSVIGELGEGFDVVEDGGVRPGSKGTHMQHPFPLAARRRRAADPRHRFTEPVEISLPAEGSHNIGVQPLSIEDEMHPAYKKSTIVSTASKASRLLVTTSDYVTKTIQSQADGFTQKTKPVTFTPTTHARIRRINQFSTKAAGLSAATVGSIGKVAQNFGAHVTKRKDGSSRGYDKDGRIVESYKPGVLNKSLMAFNTVVDGVEQAGRTLLTGTSSSVTTVVGHRWGEEAGEVSRNLGGGVKNVGLVYIDVAGVSRRAVLKSVAKGMIVGKVKGGGQVIVGGGEADNPAILAAAAGNGQGPPGPGTGLYQNSGVASGYQAMNKQAA